MDRQKKIVKTSILGIVVNLLLVAFKATIGLIVNSIAIVLDAVNNLSDAISSIITIVGAKLSNKAPDKEHPYGHGRIEYFASVLIAAILLIAGVASLKESFEKIIYPVHANYNLASIIIVVTAIITKLLLGSYVKKVGENLNCQSLIASGTDAFMDAILSISTLIAAIISLAWNLSLEGYLGLVISIIIIKSSIDILKNTLNLILGERADPELSKRLRKKINSYNEVQGTYDLNIHNYGPSKLIASAHIQVRGDMTAEEIYILTRKIGYDIFKEFGIVITIGIHAANDKGEFKDIKRKLDNTVKKYKEILQVHGFYVDINEQNIFFDLIIDFNVKEEDREKIKDEVILKLKEKYPNYKYNVIIDSDITD